MAARFPDSHGRTIRGLDALGGLRADLKARAEADRLAQARAREEAARREREANVFRDALAGVRPLPASNRADVRRPLPDPIPRQTEADEQAALEESISDEIGVERFLDVDGDLWWHRTGINSQVVRDLRRGRWSVTAEIDLHGLRVDEARTALVAFLADCVARERRCVRIVHGKGLGSAGKQPVLKPKVAKWLAQRDCVIAFCQARPVDGGGGAVIALLR